MYIFFIDVDTTHSGLDPSTTAIQERSFLTGVATGQCDGGSSLSEVLYSQVELTKKKKKKKERKKEREKGKEKEKEKEKNKKIQSLQRIYEIK